uniref:Uncharacterized protein n=1 Tax=Arundo donax TaxID=35708 RepID=A0A0A9EZM7_ARUDO
MYYRLAGMQQQVTGWGKQRDGWRGEQVLGAWEGGNKARDRGRRKLQCSVPPFLF